LATHDSDGIAIGNVNNLTGPGKAKGGKEKEEREPKSED